MKSTNPAFRTRVGDKYCRLDMGFHELGCLIPDATLETAHIFWNLNAANHACTRTYEVQASVKRSHIRDFKKLKPILFDGGITVEKFDKKTGRILE